MHLPSLFVALTIMLGGTLYPPLMADAAGKADHGLALALFLAMSTGLIRGWASCPVTPSGGSSSRAGPARWRWRWRCS
jgi:hypothetical protein